MRGHTITKLDGGLRGRKPPRPVYYSGRNLHRGTGHNLRPYSRSLKYETLGNPARSVARAQHVARGNVSNKEGSLSLAQPRDRDE